jgi:hypothetical protein
MLADAPAGDVLTCDVLQLAMDGAEREGFPANAVSE